MEQEVWITLRFKGYADAKLDADKMAADLLADLTSHLHAGTGTHGFMPSQPGDVIEVEEEAQIYDND